MYAVNYILCLRNAGKHAPYVDNHASSDAGQAKVGVWRDHRIATNDEDILHEHEHEHEHRKQIIGGQSGARCLREGWSTSGEVPHSEQ